MSQPIWALVEGRDADYYQLSTSFVEENLKDWFGQHLSTTPPSDRKLSFRQLLTFLPETTWCPFAVADGAYLSWTTENAHIDRQLRFVVVCLPTYTGGSKPSPNAPTSQMSALAPKVFQLPTLCIVGSCEFDSNEAFLQCASWDPQLGYFNFYQRQQDLPEGIAPWIYVGCSKDAFAHDTRGKGPFDGHVNGTVIMKELHFPWVHWKSQQSSISLASCLAPDDPILEEPLLTDTTAQVAFSYVGAGEDLESFVTKGVRCWYQSRLKLDFGPSNGRKQVATNVSSWISHLLLTTTINIVAANVSSTSVLTMGSSFTPPTAFFLDFGSLSQVLDKLNYEGPPSLGQISSQNYASTLGRLGLSTVYDWEPIQVASPDEGQVPFTTLESSEEDRQGVTQLKLNKILPLKAMACLLMVDFPNPLYSWRRGSLMKYVSSTSNRLSDGSYDAWPGILAAVQSSPEARDPTSPESELLGLWATSDTEYDQKFTDRIKEYLENVNKRLSTQEGVDDYLLLAESRRRIFRPGPGSYRPTNPLAEFAMTLPYAVQLSTDPPFLEMTEDGHIRVSPKQGQVWHERSIQARVFNRLARHAHVEGGCGEYRNRMPPPKSQLKKRLGAYIPISCPAGKVSASKIIPPTWDTEIASFFTHPYWVTSDQRARVAEKWKKALGDQGIDTTSYESVETWGPRLYNYFKSAPETDLQWPEDALARLKRWINEGSVENLSGIHRNVPRHGI